MRGRLPGTGEEFTSRDRVFAHGERLPHNHPHPITAAMS
jgi:hypothetical protein